uniref:ATP synthase F0 subunit 8 n=1 Tax=Globodera rostochiensis TaxID=31243 RepID=A0A914IBU1_GLORO
MAKTSIEFTSWPFILLYVLVSMVLLLVVIIIVLILCWRQRPSKEEENIPPITFVLGKTGDHGNNKQNIDTHEHGGWLSFLQNNHSKSPANSMDSASSTKSTTSSMKSENASAQNGAAQR